MAQTVAGLLTGSIFLDEGLVDVVWVLVRRLPTSSHVITLNLAL